VAEFTSHTPGTFSWPELSTTDQKGAVAFYRALFGWDLNDQPMGPGETRQGGERRLHHAS
jgi:predicted enzyme related to lactoylglutathione lyase